MLTRRLSALTLSVVIVLSACGGSATPAPSSVPPPPPSSAAPKPAASAPAASASAKPAASTSASAKPAGSASGSAAAKPAASSVGSVKSAYVVLSTHTLPSWIADDQGFFKQQGLDVQFSYIAGSTAAVPALLSGELGILHASPASAVQAALKGGDTVVLAQHIGTADNRLVARPGINSIADLKGKSLAVTRAGTVSDLIAREMLRRNNLVPDKDVSITFIGDQNAMAAALQTGTIQAALVDVPFYLINVRNGAHVVFNTRELNYPYPVDGIVSSRKFVKEHPEQVDAFLKGYLQGIRFEKANPQKTQEILGKNTKETDAELLKTAYDNEMEILVDPPVPSLDGIKTILPLFEGEGHDPAEFVDNGPLMKAVQELGSAK